MMLAGFVHRLSHLFFCPICMAADDTDGKHGIYAWKRQTASILPLTFVPLQLSILLVGSKTSQLWRFSSSTVVFTVEGMGNKQTLLDAHAKEHMKNIRGQN